MMPTQRSAGYTNDSGDGGFAGAGSAGGGGTASATSVPTVQTQAAVPAKRSAGSGLTRWTYLLKITATGVPQPGPCYFVPEGCQVRIRANGGTLTGNTAVVSVAEYREKLLSGLGTPLAPFDDIQIQAGNLARLWFMGTAGDGVVLSVQQVVAGS
jgi:hypothetical protein